MLRPGPSHPTGPSPRGPPPRLRPRHSPRPGRLWLAGWPGNRRRPAFLSNRRTLGRQSVFVLGGLVDLDPLARPAFSHAQPDPCPRSTHTKSHTNTNTNSNPSPSSSSVPTGLASGESLCGVLPTTTAFHLRPLLKQEAINSTIKCFSFNLYSSPVCVSAVAYAVINKARLLSGKKQARRSV